MRENPRGRFLEAAPLDPPENFRRPGISWPGLPGMGVGLGWCGCLCPFVASSFGRMPVCLRQAQHSANGPNFKRESAAQKGRPYLTASFLKSLRNARPGRYDLLNGSVFF